MIRARGQGITEYLIVIAIVAVIFIAAIYCLQLLLNKVIDPVIIPWIASTASPWFSSLVQGVKDGDFKSIATLIAMTVPVILITFILFKNKLFKNNKVKSQKALIRSVQKEKRNVR